jgi:hypothetical protein
LLQGDRPPEARGKPRGLSPAFVRTAGSLKIPLTHFDLYDEKFHRTIVAMSRMLCPRWRTTDGSKPLCILQF